MINSTNVGYKPYHELRSKVVATTEAAEAQPHAYHENGNFKISHKKPQSKAKMGKLILNTEVLIY